MKTIEEIEPSVVGVELMCEECGTILSVFDDECAECGTQTGFSNDPYYLEMRSEIEDQLGQESLKVWGETDFNTENCQ